MNPLPPQYSPKEVEDKLYRFWQESGYFNPDTQPNVKKAAKPYCVTIPPPNVTGTLHMGHALNNTLQDILIRRARMQGRPTLWIPGTDHAGIATQNVVEKKLRKEGITRHDLGREKFVEEVWKWKQEYGSKIIDQLKKMGCSCDWSRERFTMDQDYSRAIEYFFVHYYNKGLIYRGTRVVNWCIRCQTSISDLEVTHVSQSAKLYYFKYDKNFPITIATTRPETKFGDTAVAVNPKDLRFEKYIGKTFDINFAGIKRKIKIIADRGVDQKFGTGALGVTPAHSIIDSEMAQKNNLPSIQVIDRYGKMTSDAGKEYEGLKAKDAGAKVIEYLRSSGLMEKEEEITNSLSTCDRCGTPIEPILSNQWFLKMKEIVSSSAESVKSGKIKFYPARWKKPYLDWLENIHDWCISRQLWWGHRLPVWFCQNQAENCEINKSKTNNYIVSFEKPETCPICKECEMKQSEDVLDTWFSSALWPFATLGWPKNCEKTGDLPRSPRFDEAGRQAGERRKIEKICIPKQNSDLDKFFPTNVLSTARDILYLWVARMIFTSLEFMGKVPFKDVYIHPTVFNKEGKRMSKSLGTGIDPLELIEKFGTDATRFGLTFQNTGTQDMKFSEDSIFTGKKFANKIWNASRFVITNLNDQNIQLSSYVSRLAAKTPADKTVLNKLDRTIKQVNSDLDNFRYGQAAQTLYDFFWHDFCDIYIEASKNQVKSRKLIVNNQVDSSSDNKLEKEIDDNTQKILFHVLLTSLKLLHPIMPFVTEDIYQNLRQIKNLGLTANSIMISDWPEE